MSEIGNSCARSRVEQMQKLVSNYRDTLDRRVYFDKEEAAEAYKAFMNSKLQNPTLADVVMNYSMKKHPLNYPEHFEKNIRRVERQTGLIALKTAVNGTIKRLYPKSAELRERIINANRIALTGVKPKLSWLEKIIFKIKY